MTFDQFEAFIAGMVLVLAYITVFPAPDRIAPAVCAALFGIVLLFSVALS